VKWTRITNKKASGKSFIDAIIQNKDFILKRNVFSRVDKRLDSGTAPVRSIQKIADRTTIWVFRHFFNYQTL